MLHKTIIFLIIISSVACAPRQIRTVAISDTYDKGIKLAHAFEPEWNIEQKLDFCFKLTEKLNDIQKIVTIGTNGKVFEQYNAKTLLNDLNPKKCTKINTILLKQIKTKEQTHPMGILLTYYDGLVEVVADKTCKNKIRTFNSDFRQSIKIQEFHSSDESYALSSAAIYLALKAALLDMEQQYKKACL